MSALGRLRGSRWIWLVPLLVALVAAPFGFSPYRNTQLTLVIVYAVAVLGLNLLMGYGGEISLGHGAFFALGAYVTAVLEQRAGIPALLALVPAAAAGYLAGLLLGLPALRLRGLYLALLTLGLTVSAAPIIKRLGSLTGGSGGLTIPQPGVPSWLGGLAEDQFVYLLVLAIAVLAFAALAAVARGEAGRAILALRDNELAARTAGVPASRVRVLLFAWSAMYASLAGGLYVFAIGFIAPESFTLMLSLSFLAAVVVGGAGSVAGAALGALFIVFVPDWAGSVQQELPGVVYGAALIVCVYALPRGAVGALQSVTRRARRQRATGRVSIPNPQEEKVT